MNQSRLFDGRRPTGTFWVVAVVLAIFLTGGIFAVANHPADTTAAAASEGKTADAWKCTACRRSDPTSTAEPTDDASILPTTVIVPDASKGLAEQVSYMKELGLKPTVLDATGADVTYQYEYGDTFSTASIFVSQSPAGGTEVEDGASVTVKVRDPKVVVSADFSAPGGTITLLDGTTFSQVTGAPQHWEKEVPYGDSTKYTFTNPYAAGTLTCKITQEGEVVQTNSASGAFASANC